MFANLKKRFLVMALIVMMLGVPIAAFSTSLAGGAVSTFPYYQGFESGSANAVINEANWGSNQWYYKASQKHSGSLSAGAAITTTGDDTRRLFVNVDFSGKVCASISYWYRITSVDTTVRLMRLIGSNNGGNTWFVLRDWTNISNATSWTQFSADQNLSMFTNHSNCCIKIQVKCLSGHNQRTLYVDDFCITVVNHAPTTPTPFGPISGYTGTSYTYSTSATDPDGDQVRYYFSWGDGTTGTWTGWVSSGSTASASHSWSSPGTYYVMAKAQDIHGADSAVSSSLTVVISTSNRPPNTPSKPSGPTSGYTGTSYTYSTSATDPDGNDVRYRFDWGDGSISDWTDWACSGWFAYESHSWSSPGTYQIKAQAQDSNYATSGWSSSLAVAISNPPSPDFSISVSPTSGPVQQGSCAGQITVSVTSVGGYNQTVNLSVEIPGSLTYDRIHYNLSPQSGTPPFGSNMTLEVGSPAAGTYTITIRGNGADGKVHSCSYQLSVSVPPPQTYPDDYDYDRNVGIWYIRYTPNGEPDALGFWETLRDAQKGYNLKFKFWQNQARENHFIKPGLGGQDNRYADAVDFAYIVFHGNPGVFQVPGTPLASEPATNIPLGNCEWGNGDMEWAFTRCCNLLEEDGLGWHYSLFDHHLHGITGFHTDSPWWDDFGTVFAIHISQNMGIKDAWIKTGQDCNNSDKWVAVLRACLIGPNDTIEKDYGNECLPGFGSGMYSDPGYFGGSQEDYWFWYLYTRAQCVEWGEVVGGWG
jgi:hypothetical protein